MVEVMLCTHYAIIAYYLSKVSIPIDGSENKLLTRLAEEYYIACDAEAQSGKTAWIGIEPDPTHKGRWQDMSTQEYISYSNWKPGSGGNNCAFVITGEEGLTGKWGDSYCSPQSPRRVCTICEFQGKCCSNIM